MKLLVLGATGGTGQKLVEQLLSAGHEVTALVRNPAAVTTQNPKLTVVQGEATQSADLQKALAGKEGVVSAFGSRKLGATTLMTDLAGTLVAAMKQAGVRRLVWQCACGVGPSKDLFVRSSWFLGHIIMPLLLKGVYADKATAAEVIEKSDLDWVIVRPVALNNKPPTGNVKSTTDMSATVSGVNISRADVASFLAAQVASDTFLRKEPVIYT